MKIILKTILAGSFALASFAQEAEINDDKKNTEVSAKSTQNELSAIARYVPKEKKVENTIVEDVDKKALKSADLAESLAKSIPSISLVRRSGIANDIILRGQKKDNINILIDGTKIHGACPNRMDPPTSHILANNIESIEVKEGPFDVENMGTLSGAVKINTKKPTSEFKGDLNLNAGSFGYKKASLAASGGTKKVRALVSASKEESEQYKDGNGDTFAQQIISSQIPSANQYQDKYSDMKAYEKSTLMGKVFVDITDSQELKLSYTQNRSENILYPSSKMDAVKDDSDIYNIEYSIKDISKYSKELGIQYYDSKVDHPMSTKYRNSALTMGDITSALTTGMTGAKIQNRFDAGSTEITFGLDSSIRNWDGTYYKDGVSMKNLDGSDKRSVTDVDTKNSAFFAKAVQDAGGLNIQAGVRYDDTTITPASTQQQNDYSSFSANIFATYSAGENTKYFSGIGRSVRVPDARELYFLSSMGTEVGTPDLEQTTNTELDIGIEKGYDLMRLNAKLFYSRLNDYIYYNASKTSNNFENIDASIYGLEVSGRYAFVSAFYLDYGVTYQRGQKDEALDGQKDKDLAEIPPVKANISANYDYDSSMNATIDIIAADSWSNYDEDNGEQRIDGYTVVNVKAKKRIGSSLELTVGVDNLFDKAYAVSNTYKDLTLLSDGSDIMLLNEPGRYFYTNLNYRF